MSLGAAGNLELGFEQTFGFFSTRCGLKLFLATLELQVHKESPLGALRSRRNVCFRPRRL